MLVAALGLVVLGAADGSCPGLGPPPRRSWGIFAASCSGLTLIEVLACDAIAVGFADERLALGIVFRGVVFGDSSNEEIAAGADSVREGALNVGVRLSLV